MAPSAAFSPLAAVALVFVAWGTFLVVGVAVHLAGAPLLAAVGAGQLSMLVVAAGGVKLQRRDARALGLMRPRGRFVAAAVLIGSSMWLVNLALVNLMDLPDEDAVLAGAIEEPPLLLVMLVFVVAPAICEEVVFRGALLRGLATRLVPAAAIVVSSVVFSVYHLNPPQMLPTLLLGLALAVIALRGGSTIPAMLAHALNNGIAVLFTRDHLTALANAEQTGLLDRQPVVGIAIAGGLVIAGLALALTGERSA